MKGVGQFLHVTLYSFPSARKADRARREMGGVAKSYMVPLFHSVPSAKETDMGWERDGWSIPTWSSTPFCPF